MKKVVYRVEFRPIPAVDRNGQLPLSFAQQRLWFLAQMGAEVSSAYHITFGLRLKGNLDRTALSRALDRIIERHEALRTTFVRIDDEPVQQIVAAEDSGFALVEHDLRQHPDLELERLQAEEASTPFDLETGPMIRGRLIQIAEDEHALLITMHHIVSDGWSMGVLVNEVSALYGAFLRGEGDPLPPLEIQYADYAVWQRRWIEGEILRQQADYWKRALTGTPALLELPTDRPRPAEQDFAGALAPLELDGELASGLRDLSKRHGTTLYMTLLAGWAALLSRLSGQQDVVIGSPSANRGRAEIENLIGSFVNTLALRIDLSSSPTVGELLARVKQQAIAAQQNQDIPFEQVVELAQPERSLAHNPLFQVMFQWQNAAEGALELSGLETRPLQWVPHRVAKFDLALNLQESGEHIVGGVEYATALFDPATIERYLGYFRRLLEAMVADDTQAVDRLDMLSAAERRQVLYEWNDTEAAFPRDKCIHQLIEEQVARTPEATAVVFEGNELSYQELNRRANQLAHYLRELGVGPDARVALCLERGLEMIVGLLAVLKAGGAYVPLDPAYPQERLRFMLEDSAPVALLMQAHLRHLFTGISHSFPVLDLTDATSPWQQHPESNLDPASLGLTSNHLAYVIYTSGSTGTPKGVLVEHASFFNTLVSTRRELQLNSLDRTAFVSGQAFDISLWELLTLLTVGGAVEIWKREQLLEMGTVLASLQRITMLHAVPSLMHEIVSVIHQHQLSTMLRVAVTGGDTVPRDLIEDMRGAFKKASVRVFYGPTETAILASSFDCQDWDAQTAYPPIGRPIANARIYILDIHGEPVPVGVAGELCIGGVGVARGYLNRPELTAEKFVRDPFVSEPGARMYKTGDLGRWLPDGNIEFLGRNDFQVKVRGFRIELGEIEARLGEYPGIRQAVVIAREDTSGDKRLVAYYTSDPEASIDAQGLRAHLLTRLPEYMVPAAYVTLENLPLTPNGKLDRKALPAPEADAYAARDYEAPQGEIETKLAQIWAEVLNVDRIGRHDNFFELGGHSLLVVRVVARVCQMLGIEIGIRDLFAHPELADLARLLESAAQVELPAITPSERNGQLPLSFAQQRLWFLAQMGAEVSSAYHITFGLRLKGNLDRTALSRALDRIIERHEALRTTFVRIDDEPVQQIVAAEDSGFALVEHDLRQHPDLELERLQAEEASTPFDLETGPMIRGRLIQIAEDEHALLITMHHIVSDGWSMGVLVNEVSALYGAFLRGEGDPLPPLEIQYADYAVWQRRWIEGEILRQQADYWKRALTGTPALLELPTDRPRPAEQDFAGALAPLELDGELASGLRDLSKRHGTTLYMTLLAGWAALLSRLSGQQDVVIGSPSANRGRAEIENLIGFFVNTLALRIDLSSSPTVGELLARVKQQAIAAQQNQDIPFEQVVELAQPERSLAHNPLFQVMFQWQNAAEGALELSGLETRPLQWVPHRTAKFDLTLNLQESGEHIVGGVEYATALFDPATIERYLGYFRRLLEAMVADDTQAVDRLDMLSAAERRQVLYEWNDTEAAFPRDKCIHQLIEEQVARTPEATAVVFEGNELSYQELNRRANQLAHYLRELGVGPDARVALCLERGLEMIVGLLAVLKAGGAYVPLDPAYPQERLRFMLEDSAPVALLMQAHLRHLFTGISHSFPVLDLTDATSPWQQHPESNLDPASLGLTSNHLAYVIYTSGSTGTPKGVMVEHRGIVNRLDWMQCAYQLKPPDAVLQKTSFGFDVSVWELFWPLLAGVKLVMAKPESQKDTAYLIDVIRRNNITTIHFVPSMLQVFLNYTDGNKASSLTRVVSSGEVLDVILLKHFQAQFPNVILYNLYGPTEVSVDVTAWNCFTTVNSFIVPIGRPIANARIYILDIHGEPVPVGVAGELCIGGVGVARGYLNRPELTAEKFVRDPFVSEPGARMYKTGDLGRWLPDGNIEFLGRNDFQVKVRGFRIELGEIEARLGEYPGIRQAVVIAREDTSGDKRLVAYYTSDPEASIDAQGLRAHLLTRLPEYMVPAAYVTLENLPLTPNGKLDRKALPAPEADAYAARDYEAPQGEIETKLAQIWAEVLNVDRIGRHDNFFELGGHSLLAVTLIERMRRSGLRVDVRAVFMSRTLTTLAATVDTKSLSTQLPANRIPFGCEAITPEMLTLVELTGVEIQKIVSRVPGGAANVQDIYPLAPLQEGILFHHLLGGEGDPYLQTMQLSFDNRARLDRYVRALQSVIDRHDILRTAVQWEGLPEPVQVVYRNARLPLEEVVLDEKSGDSAEHLYARFSPRRFRIDVRQAPLIQLYVAYDIQQDRWLMMMLLHHLAIDHTTFEVLQAEIQAHLLGQEAFLPEPLSFRSLIAQARMSKQEEYERT